MTNPLKDYVVSSEPDRISPPKDKLERQRFWLAHGRQSLDAKGMTDLQWSCKDGHYFIESRRA